MPIIKNYGLRWRRDRIAWGAGSRRGHLSGVLVGSKRSDPVDFREQIGIYILYEAGFLPVYVGQSGNGNARLYSRLKSHQDGRLRDRWEYFSFWISRCRWEWRALVAATSYGTGRLKIHRCSK